MKRDTKEFEKFFKGGLQMSFRRRLRFFKIEIAFELKYSRLSQNPRGSKISSVDLVM